MTYTALINDIKANHQDSYYELVLTHSGLILEEIGRTSKTKVATDLQMKQPQFSIAYKYIVAHHNVAKEA